MGEHTQMQQWRSIRVLLLGIRHKAEPPIAITDVCFFAAEFQGCKSHSGWDNSINSDIIQEGETTILLLACHNLQHGSWRILAATSSTTLRCSYWGHYWFWKELLRYARDFSAQETAHILLSLPLVRCSFNFITISLSGLRKINRDKDTGELMLQMEDDAEPEVNFSNINLQDFAANYSISNGKATKRAKPVVVRTFHYYSCNPQGEQYPRYCNYQ